MGMPPLFSYKDRKERVLPITIHMKGDITQRVDELKGIFDTYDEIPKALVVQDIGNANTQWSVCGVPVTQTIDNRNMKVGLMLPDPIWKATETTTTSWVATSSPFDVIVYTRGNREAYPTITLTGGTSGKGGEGQQFLRHIFIRSRANLFYDGALANYPVELTGWGGGAGGWGTSALVATNTCLLVAEASAINASQTSFQVRTAATSGGIANLDIFGMALIQSEQITYTSRVLNPTACITGVTRAVNGTVAVTHGCAIAVQQSKMQADGDDLRVLVDTVEVPRWLVGVNTSSTKVWITRDWSPVRELILGGSVGTGVINNLRISPTPNNIAVMNAIPPSGLVVIENEAILYNGKTVLSTSATLNGIIRGVQGTTVAAHGSSGTVYPIAQNITITYGSSALASPIQSDQHRPAFDITNSYNAQWDYKEFYSNAATCGGAWTPTIVTSRGGSTSLYGGSRSNSSPVGDIIGLAARSFAVGSIWQDEDLDAHWVRFNAAGIWQVTMNGEKRRTGASGAWPSRAALWKFDPVTRSVQVWNEANPTNANTWYTWTRSTCATTGSPPVVFMKMLGTLTGSADKEANLEVSAATIFLVQDRTPAITFGSEIGGSGTGGGGALGIYDFNMNIANQTLGGSSVKVNYPTIIGQDFEIDTENKNVTYHGDGTSPLGAIRLSSARTHWLPLSAGSNTIRIEEPGLTQVTVNFTWKNRNA